MAQVTPTPVLDALGRPRVQTVNSDPSLTVQSDAKKADITHIINRYKRGELVTNLNQAEAQFADISAFTDFADAMRHVRTAETEFLKLPSKIRELFNHDVANWLDHAHDEDKREQMVQAGLMDPPPAPTTTAPAPAPAPASAAGDTTPAPTATPSPA